MEASRVIYRQAAILLLFLFLFSAHLGFGKAKEYDDIFAELYTENIHLVYQDLIDYQRENPEHANTYYQLGRINQQLMRQYDLIENTDLVRQKIYDAELYYGLCLKFFEKGDVRRTWQYYKEIEPKTDESRPEYEDMVAYIKKQLKDVREFKKHVVSINRYFRATVNNYAVCTKTFKKINSRSPRLNNLYFSDIGNLRDELKMLRQAFDSCIYNLEMLQASLQDFPEANYQPKYFLIPITVYRLHGLTTTNFYDNTIDLWDYGTWHDDFINTLDNVVGTLVRDAGKYHKLHEQYTEALIKGQLNKVPAQYELSPLLANQLMKYDNGSALARLITYEAKKVPFMYNALDLEQKRAQSAAYFKLLSPNALYQTYSQKKEAELLFQDFSQHSSLQYVQKYNDFFYSTFGDLTAVDAFKAKDSLLLISFFDRALLSYVDPDTQPLSKADSSLPFIMHDGAALYKSVFSSVSSDQEGYFPASVTIDEYGMYLYAGAINRSGKSKPFVAYTDTADYVLWLTTLPNTGYSATHVASTGEGCVAVLKPVDGNTANTPILVKIGSGGNVQTSEKLVGMHDVQNIMVNEIEQTVTLVSSEENVFNTEFQSNGIVVQERTYDLSLSSADTIAVEGSVISSFSFGQTLVLIGGYKEVEYDGAARHISADWNRCFIATVDSSFAVDFRPMFENTNNLFPLHARKVDSEKFEFVAKEIDPDGKSWYTYYLFDPTGTEIEHCRVNATKAN